MTGRIFISYRRSDSQYATDRIYDRLSSHFGSDRVFMDIDNIPLGVNFREYIDQQISTSDIVLTVIGDHWLNAVDPKGQPRLQNPSDFVRLEIEAALKLGITLIPVFIGGVEALPANSLPDNLKELSMLNATRIRRGDDFLPDVDRLIRGIEHIEKQQTAQREENKAGLQEIEHSATEILSRLSAFEVVLIQEMRKRTQLEKEAQTIAAIAQEHLKDSRKQLRVDIAEYQIQIDKLQDNLTKLALQIEARKQGTPVDDDLLFEKPEIPERKKKQPRKKTPRQARERKNPFTHVPIWAWAGGAVFLIALVWGLTSLLSGGTSTSESEKTNNTAETNAADTAFTLSSTPTSSSLESAKASWMLSNHDFIFWMSDIANTTPDYIEDFSISQSYWEHDSESAYRIVDQPSSYTDYVLTLPWETPGSYLWQFDFTPIEFAYGSHLKVKIGSDGLFRVQTDGTWELQTLSGGLNLYDGTIADFNAGHTYQIQVCVWQSEIAILIDNKLVIYLEDQQFSPGPFEIIVDSYKPINVTLDNMEIWDLSDWNYEEVPEHADARSFYTPIREHLGMTTPDFAEDFETPQPYWEEMQVDLSDTISVDLAILVHEEGILRIDRNPGDHPDFRLNFPDLHGESFAIQYDFHFDTPGYQETRTTAGFRTSWGLDGAQEEFSPYCDFYQNPLDIWCGLAQISPSGEIGEYYNKNIQLGTKTIDSHYTLLAIFYHGQYALFLDNFFMGYVDGLDLNDQQIAILVGWDNPQDIFGVEIDNIQFWNLDSWDPPQQGDGTSSSDLDYEFILEYVQTELPPTFEDDFSTARGEWGATLSDNREITSMIQDEILVAENRQGDLKFPMTGFLNAENFVLSFDFIPGTIEESVNGSIGVEFLASGFSGNQYYKFKISYSALGMGTDAWLYSQADGSGVRTTDNGVVAVKDNDFNRVQILVVQGQLVVVVNDKLVYQDFGLTTWGSDIYFVKGGETNSRLSMDNVTFWNLDGVDLNP